MNFRHPLFVALAVLAASAAPARACDSVACEQDNPAYIPDVGRQSASYGEPKCIKIPGCTVASHSAPSPHANSGNAIYNKETKNGTKPVKPIQDSPPIEEDMSEHDMGPETGAPAQGIRSTSQLVGGGGLGLGNAIGNKMNHAGNLGIQNGLTDEQLIQAVRNAAKEKALDPRYKGYGAVISATAESVIAAVGKDKDQQYGADQGQAFGQMLDLEMGKQLALEDLNRRNRLKPMKPEEFAAEKAKIMSGVNMSGIPGGVVMDTFHVDFDKHWQAELAKNPRPDAPTSGLPTGGHINDMIRSNPKSPNNWALSGMEKLASGDKAGGLQDLDRSISLGGTADAFGLRGGLRAEANDFVGAYRDALKALEMAPGDKALMGLLKSVEGRVPPELRAELSRGGSSAGASGAGAGAAAGSASSGGGSPGFGGGFATGGWMGGPAKTVEGMTSPATLASNQKMDEARRAWSLGDFNAAVAAAERALELNPNNATAYSFLAGVYASRGDYKKSLAAASAGLALAPRDGQLLNSKAFAQNRLKRYQDALESSNGAIESDSRNPYSFANRAHAYGGLGDRDAMLADLNRAAGLDPRFQKTAAQMASQLQLPSNADVLFLFPGEDPNEGAASAPAPRKGFGAVLFAAGVGGVLLALGLLSTVLAPLKESVVSAFTKATRRGPSLHPLEMAAPEPASAVETGLIKGQYEISRQIGAGGMGMVYEGTDRSLGRRVAIKKMRDELRVNARERDRFVIEAKTVASLHHPNIVDIYAIAEESGDVYLVFEYVDGKTVHDLVQADGRLQAADAVRVTRAIGDALGYAHAHGVIHRDMKPSNVMLTSDGRVKVMDFGIARMAKDALTRYSMTNTVVGTPPYMAPEQEQGVVRKESDVYSLAICAYEMLTGKLPFIGMGAGMLMNKINMSYIPPSRAIAGLPVSFDEVFLKAFQADPENRYRTPQEFCAALEAAAGGTRQSSKAV